MFITEALNERERSSKGPVKVAIIGAGQMGEGLITQMEIMKGLSPAAVCDVRPGRAREVLESARVSDPIVETDDPAVAAQALREGKRVATTTAQAVFAAEPVEIVVEATGVPEIGAYVAYHALLARKHVLQMNVETDATVGYILRKTAKAAGVVYTLTAGDEPGTTMELYDFAVGLGFQVVSAGKGKNNPLNRHGNPETEAEKAKKQMMNPKMLASFVDGTKTMVEMTSLGNAIGFPPDVRGMHGPEATPKTIQNVFVPREAGGVLSRSGVVDYGLGIAPGVFVVITAEHPKLLRDLTYLGLGDGPYYALYRPYHLTSLETPISIARAVLHGQTTIATDIVPVCETVTYAKKDLKAGETIDSLGGFTVYGMIEHADTAHNESLLPLGLAPGAVLKRDVAIDTPVTYADVELNPDSYIVQLRRMQDTLIKEQKA